MSARYTVPDHNLTDTDADARDAYDLELEARRAEAWQEMLSDDGDIGEVLELLTEYPEDVLPLLVAFRHGESLVYPAERLAARLHALADDIIEASL